jgi:Holliday junction resolvasome RuvABC DNA-binding subunit
VIPGIGKKTAERLLVELKEKVQGLAMGQCARPA